MQQPLGESQPASGQPVTADAQASAIAIDNLQISPKQEPPQQPASTEPAAAAPPETAPPPVAEPTVAASDAKPPVDPPTVGALAAAAPPAAKEPAPSGSVDAEQEEVQNALTKEFTEEEWIALKAFRKELPEYLARAYPEKPDAKTSPTTLWGVKIDPTAPQKDARVSVILMKFLRARYLNVQVASDMFVATLRWRDLFDVLSACKEVYPKEVFGNLGHVYGRDKGGRPIVYNLYGGVDNAVVFGDLQRFLRWKVAMMEQAVSFLDFETVDQTLQIHDYNGVGLTSHDTNSKNAATEASALFQSYYPELLFRKFFVNVPTVLAWMFKLFKPLIAAKTLAKMAVVGTGPRAIGHALTPYVDPAELPKAYGGTAPGFHEATTG